MLPITVSLSKAAYQRQIQQSKYLRDVQRTNQIRSLDINRIKQSQINLDLVAHRAGGASYSGLAYLREELRGVRSKRINNDLVRDLARQAKANLDLVAQRAGGAVHSGLADLREELRGVRSELITAKKDLKQLSNAVRDLRRLHTEPGLTTVSAMAAVANGDISLIIPTDPSENISAATLSGSTTTFEVHLCTAAAFIFRHLTIEPVITVSDTIVDGAGVPVVKWELYPDATPAFYEGVLKLKVTWPAATYIAAETATIDIQAAADDKLPGTTHAVVKATKLYTLVA